MIVVLANIREEQQNMINNFTHSIDRPQTQINKVLSEIETLTSSITGNIGGASASHEVSTPPMYQQTGPNAPDGARSKISSTRPDAPYGAQPVIVTNGNDTNVRKTLPKNSDWNFQTLMSTIVPRDKDDVMVTTVLNVALRRSKNCN